MALTNNLLVNLDEFEAIRPSQHAALKQTLSKSKVNGRPIYGDSQADRPRYASFVATTNNPHPLTDVTGSRRYICIQIPKGMYINNVGDIDYRQLYAQVLYELQEQKAPYWFNNEEVTRLQELNAGFMGECDLTEIISICFRHPDSDENVSPLTCSNILDTIRMEYPQVAASHSQKIKLGALLHKLGYDGKITKEGMKYNIVRKAS
jgi:ssRNA-specific RNase YbeY (16S rRNA maturation enzyme)